MKEHYFEFQEMLLKLQEEEQSLLRRDSGDIYFGQSHTTTDLGYFFLKTKINDFSDSLIDYVHYKGSKLSEYKERPVNKIETKNTNETEVLNYKKTNISGKIFNVDIVLNNKKKSLLYTRDNEYIRYIKKTGNSFYDYESFKLAPTVENNLNYNNMSIVTLYLSKWFNTPVEYFFIYFDRINVINDEYFIVLKTENNFLIEIRVETDGFVLWKYNNKIINHRLNCLDLEKNLEKVLNLIGKMYE